MKTFNGIVTSLKMQNTVVVEVVRRQPHPLYRKLMRRTKKYQADTNGMTLSVGAMVTIVKTRPISKLKHFKVIGKPGTTAPAVAEKPAKRTRKEKTA